ncbi:hypothetical protein B0T25DRAFT_562870 [Lasiosphaeria hispida]|uniref:Uncharacterized protein n=1 Tax=Lasiosphaeria hispida TaxID=260671 RepID=A0AAJ0HW36_9PEZI|nr:hypothetical protein B0T25DRAFT_562870 [Lasiosphaeria hispida]
MAQNTPLCSGVSPDLLQRWRQTIANTVPIHHDGPSLSHIRCGPDLWTSRFIVSELLTLASQYRPKPTVTYVVPDDASIQTVRDYFHDETYTEDALSDPDSSCNLVLVLGTDRGYVSSQFAVALGLLMARLYDLRDRQVQHSVTIMALSPEMEPVWSVEGAEHEFDLETRVVDIAVDVEHRFS